MPKNENKCNRRGRTGHTAGHFYQGNSNQVWQRYPKPLYLTVSSTILPGTDIQTSNSWSTTIQQLPKRTGSLPGQPGTHLTLESYPKRQQRWRAPDSRHTGRKLKPIIYLPPSKKLQMLSSRLRTRWKVSRTICCWISSGYGIKEVKVNRGVGGRQSEKLHFMDGDEKGEKCFRAGNDLNIWYQFPEEIKVMSKGKTKGESMENG